MHPALLLLLLAAAPASAPAPAAPPSPSPAAALVAPAADGPQAAPADATGKELPAPTAGPATLVATPTGMPSEAPEALVLGGQEGDLFAAGVWPGRPFQGAILVVDVAGAEELKQVRGSFGKKKLRWHKLSRRTWRGLAPVSDDAAPEETKLTLELSYSAPARKKGEKRQPARPKEERSWLLPVQAVAFDKDELKVNPRFTKIPAEALEQIKTDREHMNAMWAKGSASQPFFRKNFLKPRDARTTAPYGTRRVFNGVAKSVHYGWDIDGKTGDPVLCTNDGVVMLAEELYYSGGTMFIDHGGGLYSCYFHLSEFVAKEGDRVKRGQLCGKVGKSGRVTGPHLHWGSKIGGSYVHPETLLLFDWEKPLVQPPATAPEAGEAPLPAPAPR